MTLNLINNNSSYLRIYGLIRKEFILIVRDRGTIAMLVIMPIMLLILFGFAIKLDPKHLPTAVVSYDNSPLTRSFISNLNTSNYFNITDVTTDLKAMKHKISTGKLSFIIIIPANFTKKFIRGENPQLVAEIDGSDPGSSASALGNIKPILDFSLSEFSARGLGVPKSNAINRTANLVIHRLYNESNISAFDIVPGLIGVLLTITMVMLTSTAITSEYETGTMETLLSTPLKPTEIILGKVFPYIVLGYIQLTSILIFGKLLINIPIEGSLITLYIAATPFMIANLMVGMIFSTIATTPMQAMQLSTFYQLPSMFLSGYMFSFYGMPAWAQAIGSCIPMTYFMRITRGILLKGIEFEDIAINIWPIIVIAVILVILTRLIFRKTLD